MQNQVFLLIATAVAVVAFTNIPLQQQYPLITPPPQLKLLNKSKSQSKTLLRAKGKGKNDSDSSKNPYLDSLEGSSKTFVLKKNQEKGNKAKKAAGPGFSLGKIFSSGNYSFPDTMEKTLVGQKNANINILRNVMPTKPNTPVGQPNVEIKQEIPVPAAAKEESSSSGSSNSKMEMFSFQQKIESTKTGIVGLFAGGIAVTPVAAFHDILFPGETITNGVAQWEFDTDMGSIQAALFAIVYRYCVREGEQENEMLPMGVIGAFALVRTLSRVRVDRYCSAAPLDCGAPFGYLNWDMTSQALYSGLESAVMFGAAAAAMELCYKKGIINRISN